MLTVQGLVEKHRFLTKNMYRIGAKRAEQRRQAEFVRLIDDAKAELKNAHKNFNYATDTALLEYYIYEIKAAETKLSYYLQRAKNEHIINPDYSSFIFNQEGERSMSI